MKNLTVEEARARMLAGAGRLEAETVALEAAAVGRVVAADLRSLRDQPPFRASAMDGYAVRFADADGRAATLTVAGESAAGRGYGTVLQPGQAVRIFTGAALPEGADTVVIQEEAVREGEAVTVGPLSEASGNVRPRGGDFREGETLLAAGLALDPWRLSLAASAGAASLTLARSPRVAIFGGGDELVAPGETPGPWQIFESTTLTLAHLVRGWGGTPLPQPRLADRLEAIVEAIRNIDCDLILTVGGASVGDHDLVRPAQAQLGLELTVASIAMRPGKPTFFGTLADGRRVLGLAGNPASAMVGAELFLRSILLQMQGADPSPRLERARLTAPMKPNTPREHWVRAGLSSGDDGALLVRPFPEEDSSLVSVFARADALLRRPPSAPAAAAGEVVEVLRLPRL